MTFPQVHLRSNHIIVIFAEPLITDIPELFLLKLQYCANATKLQRDILPCSINKRSSKSC